MRTLAHDLRSGWRQWARRPLTTAAMVLVLALGIGAPAAIWSVVDLLWLRPLAFPDSDHLVLLWETHAELSAAWRVASPRPAVTWQQEIPELAGLAFSRLWRPVLNGTELRGLPGARVSSGFFSVLGVAPRLGRDFTPEDDRPGAAPVVIVSHRLWQNELGGNPAVIGQTLELEGSGASLSATVVGVLPPRVTVAPPVVFEAADVFMPLAIDPRDADPADRYYRVIGRLADGSGVEALCTRLAALAPRLAAEHPESHRGWSAIAETVTEEMLAPRRPALVALVVAVGFVFLVAVSHVALLVLAQAIARRHETAVRSVLGARPYDLGRQRFTESLLLAGAGAAAGLALAHGVLRPGLTLGLGDWLHGREWTLDARALAVVVSLALATAWVFAVLPAARIAARDPGAVLSRVEPSGSGGRSGRRWQRLLVVVPLALSFALLVATALLAQSFDRLLRVDPGFESAGVLTAEIRIPPSIHPQPERVGHLWRRLLERAETFPRVLSAALVNHLPMRGQSMSTHAVPASERAVAEPVRVELRGVSRGYFRSLRVPLHAGREPTDADFSNPATAGVILSAAAAEKLWPGREAAGRLLFLDWGERLPREVVGVVADVRHDGLGESAKPAVYLPFPVLPHRTMTLVLRTSADPSALAPEVRARIRELDRGLVVEEIRTLDEVVATTVAARRGYTLALVGFSAGTLLLVAAGTYSLVAYSVVERRRDFGVRLALGARPRDLVRSVIAQGLGYGVAGIVLGLVLALAASRLLSGLLYGVSAHDPWTFAGAGFLMLAVALAASYLPARRAARTDPVETLRAL